MFICICKGLTEKDLREMIHQGQRSVADVESCSGAGTDCGSCRSRIERVVGASVGQPKPVFEEKIYKKAR